MDINDYLVPSRLKRIRAAFGRQEIRLLDIGCAGRSMELTKKWLPGCKYVGVDRTKEYLSAEDLAGMEKFVLADLEKDDLVELEDGAYDAIVVAHVIEHVRNAERFLAILAGKVARGGVIYVEFPSVRSLALPNAKHTLNFCDDSTHVRVYDVREVANVFLANGLTIVRAGRRREWVRVCLSALTLPRQILTYLREGRLHGVGLWDILGFADYVYARRLPAVEQSDI